MPQAMEKQHGQKFDSVTAVTGYESLENYAYLDENGQLSFIKPTITSSARRKAIGLDPWRTWPTTPTQTPLPAKTANSLPLPARENRKAAPALRANIPCINAPNARMSPRLSLLEGPTEGQQPDEDLLDFVSKRRQSLENITSQKGIVYRVNRSIQVEGAFGVLKQDWGFRRFLTRGNTNVLAQIGTTNA